MAGYGGERLGLGGSLEVVVLVDAGLPHVVVRPCIQDMAMVLEDPRPEAVAAYGSGTPSVPDADEGHG